LYKLRFVDCLLNEDDDDVDDDDDDDDDEVSCSSRLILGAYHML